MVRAGQVGGLDELQVANGTLRRQRADLGVAARTRVSHAGDVCVAGAEAGLILDDARWEAHHEQRRYRRLLAGADGGRGRVCHEQVAEVLLVHGDAVDAGVVLAGPVCLCAHFGADGDAGRQPDDADAHAVLDERADRHVDVARIGGQQGAEDDDDLACAVCWRVEEGGARHLERVLEAGIALWLLFC